MKRINLGCGSLELEEYENIDIKEGVNAYPLDVSDGSVDEIRASHLLEHFSHREVFAVVKSWVDKLKPGGVLKIAVPDFKKIIDGYLQNTSDKTCLYLMGGQTDEYDYHKCIFDKATLVQIMTTAGLEEIQPWNDKRDSCRLDISLNLQGKKPLKTEQIITVKKSAGCVISMPRLGFTQNCYCIIKELALRGIEATVGSGAYWSQVLTNIIEQELLKKHDYILTLDYDTWFKYKHLLKMMELMEVSDADCIITNQVKRDNNELLLMTDSKTMQRQDYEDNLVPVKGGHFGCTLFRSEIFEKLEKPWFLPVPGPDGRWGEGRIDADIYFWNNFIESGLKIYLAPKLRIGHLQMMCTFPGEFDDHFSPVHCYMSDIENDKLPEYVMKGIES